MFLGQWSGTSPALDLVDDTDGMTLQIPTRRMVELREERADAGLGLRLVVEDADFAAVERGGVRW